MKTSIEGKFFLFIIVILVAVIGGFLVGAKNAGVFVAALLVSYLMTSAVIDLRWRKVSIAEKATRPAVLILWIISSYMARYTGDWGLIASILGCIVGVSLTTISVNRGW